MKQREVEDCKMRIAGFPICILQFAFCNLQLFAR
jgi:hypothetical protein